jgi:hypothetical protein
VLLPYRHTLRDAVQMPDLHGPEEIATRSRLKAPPEAG